MKRSSTTLAMLLLAGLSAGLLTAAPKRDTPPVELVGQASDYYYNRNWRAYYWREDFSIVLTEEKTGKKWRIISREPTPAYGWRMGTTYPGLKVDWKSKPRVKVIGVRGVDRSPAEFYQFKLDEPNIATAFVLLVETKKDEWKEFYVNNWFHKWGADADQAIYKFYADKKPPYDVYGWVPGKAAPWDKKSQQIIDQHDVSQAMYHGQIHATKDNPFGFEMRLLQLIARDTERGGAKVLYGDASGIPKLDGRRPGK